MSQIVLSFFFTRVHELLLLYFMCFQERWYKYFPAPKPHTETAWKNIYKERKKMATVARGGMVVIKKAGLGFVGVTQ